MMTRIGKTTLGTIFERRFGKDGEQILKELQQGIDRGLKSEDFRSHARQVLAKHKQAAVKPVAFDIEIAVPDIEVADVA